MLVESEIESAKRKVQERRNDSIGIWLWKIDVLKE